MKAMPKYDVNADEQLLIDKIPEAVNSHDPQKIFDTLKALYTDKNNHPYLSAVMIIEKYLFRAHELITFVHDIGDDFDFDGYFFDEDIHNEIIGEAKSKLDADEALANYKTALKFISARDYNEAGKYFRLAALGGNIDGAYNYGVTVSNGEGCEPDPLEGAFWYWVAATEGNYKAMINLAFCFRDGQGVCADGMTMMYWNMMAGLAGSVDGVRSAASALMRGTVFKGLESIGQALMMATMDISNEENQKRIISLLTSLIGNMEKYIYNRKF